MSSTRERKQSLNAYKKYKAKILNQLGYSKINTSHFAKAKTEIAVDNIFRSILLG